MLKRSKITVPQLQNMKKNSKKITMLTAYDATFARLLDNCDVDIFLVGDSLGMVVQGNKNTLPVTIDHIIYHTQSVVRGTQFAHVVADMPFMSYQVSFEQGVINAGRLIKEGGAEAIKIEGCHDDLVCHLTGIGIPVMGHIGLTPQSVHTMGGYRIQGKNETQIKKLIEDAQILEESGIYALVLEGIPQEVAQIISKEISIPTIGIGAGPHCDGQVLVCYDLLGLDKSFSPKFVKKYANLADNICDAVTSYTEEVRQGVFPDSEHSFFLRKNIKGY